MFANRGIDIFVQNIIRMTSGITEQELVRRRALEQLEKIGINPYPQQGYEVNVTVKNILKNYEKNKLDYKDVNIAGRLMRKRVMGKASFAELQDEGGKIQLYITRDDICPGEDKTMYNVVFKKLLDIGDIIGIHGFVFTTQMGEITIHVKELKLLCKSLKPLPVVKTDQEGKTHDAFGDPEQRYRQRYVDLIVNPQVRNLFQKRSEIMAYMRKFLMDKGYLEVETPILQPIYGGATARPFITHHNTLDIPLYLRIADELYLKRLIVGGYNGVFEFAKDFRNEGMDRNHNPEFTQMELYVAYKDYEWMMSLTETMIEQITFALHGKSLINTMGYNVNFEKPWKRYTMYEAISEFTGVDISGMDEDALRKTTKDIGIQTDKSMGKGKMIDEIFSEKCEKHLINPTFITDFPIEMSPLAKKHRSKEGLVERFEVICCGTEICNAFTELNDPIDQRQRFEAQLELAKRGDKEAMVLDEDFLRALEYGMPPTAGIGVGIDRLTMLLTNSHSIQEVLLFPQMKPLEKNRDIDVPDAGEK